ncbi:MAG: ribosome small subunit-dependent GTPase A [bacterium]|nr:ribosome small subunit-dependent GTPase A [bacterium]
MARKPGKKLPAKKGTRVRVDLRHNRNKPAPQKDWTREAREQGIDDVDTESGETVSAKGDLSRKRTVVVRNDADDPARFNGTVVTMRGLFADVDDGERVWSCTVRRIVRSRRIAERHAVIVGDKVRFEIVADEPGRETEGVIEEVMPRRSVLERVSGRRRHTIAANVDQVIITTSAAHPRPKTHLIDRYIVATLAGRMVPVVCMNKIDLDTDGRSAALLERYANLGYRTLQTSAVAGSGVDQLGDMLRGTSSVITGQSGVGKSSLLNTIQPGLQLPVGRISEETLHGRHTTTTARLIKLEIGAYVVDTPGIRSFDLAAVPLHEIEMYFDEFVELIPDCKFPDCTHVHEAKCAVKDGVERGLIHPDRYKSYVRLFTEPDRRS